MLNRNRLSHVGVLSAVTSAAVGLLVLIVVPAAQAKVVSCPALITQCGCTITDANIHTLVNSISSSDGLTSKGDCIDIKHHNATLDGNGFDADGGGTGVGVRILEGATRASVQNFDFIDGWDVGVEDDAGSANITFSDISDNGTTNLFLKSVNKTVVTGISADDATGSCIILKNSNNNTLSGFEADDCGAVGLMVTGSNRNSFSCGFDDIDDNASDGVSFKNSSKNSLSDCSIDDNGGNGATFKNSNKNSLTDSQVDDNGGDGVFVDPSSQVKVSDATIDDNALNGVEIDRGSKFNSVAFICAIGNGDTDLLDNNAACSNGKNVWTNDGFDTASPSSCIKETTSFTCGD